MSTAGEYSYDADGNRVQATANGVTTNYVLDTEAGLPVVIEEADANNNELARYDYGDDLVRMDRAVTGGGALTAYYYLFDGSGSTRQLTNAAGAVTDSWTYDAYGDTTRLSGTTVNPFLYDGQEQDNNTGLYYLRARYYNARDGRFLSQDPLDGDDNDPISLHRYLYAGDSPLDMVDPGGCARVLVVFKGAITRNFAKLPIANHSFILVIDPRWTAPMYIRGGPHWRHSVVSGEGPMGDICVQHGDYGPHVVDWYPDWQRRLPSVTVVNDSRSGSYYMHAFIREGWRINAAHVEYYPTTRNSNSVTVDLLKSAGIAVPTPPVDVPGWNNDVYDTMEDMYFKRAVAPLITWGVGQAVNQAVQDLDGMSSMWQF
jgi:RHS repeat-associated protein